jgi:acetyl esterase/lipase
MTTVTITSDITYARVDGTELQLDLYRPDIEGPVPAVIYLHSGGGVGGDKASEAPRSPRHRRAFGELSPRTWGLLPCSNP